MKTARTDRAPFNGAAVAVSPSLPHAQPGKDTSLAAAWTRFWFAATDPFPLHVLRVMAGLLFLSFLLPFAGRVEEFFGLRGWLDQQGLKSMYDLSEGTIAPGWSILYLGGATSTWLTTAYWLSIAVIVLFTIGVAPRITAVLTWIAIGSFTANPAMEYEGDALLLMLSFYLMIGYVLMGQRGTGLSLWNRLAKPAGCCCFLASRDPDRAGPPSIGANLALRLLQVHFAILMVTTGLHKLQFGDWWAGVALWFPLFPPFATKMADVQAVKPYADSYLMVLNIAAYLTLAWQIGFPLFAWRPTLRFALVGGGLIAWIACAFVYRTPLIGPAIFISCVGYLSAAEWRRIVGWVLPKRRAEEGTAEARSPHDGALAATASK